MNFGFMDWPPAETMEEVNCLTVLGNTRSILKAFHLVVYGSVYSSDIKANIGNFNLPFCILLFSFV